MFKVVLLRHGESVWNKENRFTGWVDVDLTSEGERQSRQAGQLLKRQGFSFDLAFSSVLKRAIRTLELVLEEMGQSGIEIKKSWKLNERHYGALQGLNKDEVIAQYGEEQVKIWRRGYDPVLPALDRESEMYPGRDPLYADLTDEEIPLAENLKDVVERVVPYWQTEIAPQIRDGRQIIITASGNSLRALIKYLENISDEDIVEVNIPTGQPLVCELSDDLKIIKKYYLGEEPILD